jgi:hypothetical protein
MSDPTKNELYFDITYSLENEAGEAVATGSAKANLSDISLTIEPIQSNNLSISNTDIPSISDEDYKVEILLSSRDKVALS